ncbi:MAG: carbohydrate ABC transporter permease [Oscillospiraceae bacterium]|nr:carbohydrate ABC transporter permease [Oscillospiraceae bacterium]
MQKSIRVMLKTVWLVTMTVTALLFAYPFFYGVFGSSMYKTEFGEMGTLLPIPKQATGINYRFVFSMDGAIRPLVNSLSRAAWYTFVVVTMALLCGYVLSRYSFRGRNAFIIAIVATQVVPNVLTLIPSFVLVSKIPFVGGNNLIGEGGHGLINNKLMLFLPLGWGTLLWVFLFSQAMRSFPRAFEEAAEIDGCGFWGTLLRVVIPMQKPILTVIAINTALSNWNDWLTPFLYINRVSDSTVTAWLATLTSNLQQFGDKDYPRVFALATVAVLPPFMIFLFLQSYIIQGIASAGVKG